MVFVEVYCFLIFLDPPRIDKSVGRQYGCIDKMITLTCKADGDPTPNVRLTGPGGERILRETFQLRTFGIYQCVASNNLGNDSHNITVSEAKG